MSKCENIEIPVRVFRHLQCFTKPAYVSGTGVGFAGMGLGWTTRTHARPVCHPSQSKKTLPMIPPY